MAEDGWHSGLPTSILMATDLSSRCDRALDRAISLTGQWQAELVILHVLEDLDPDVSGELLPSWRRPVDPTSVARKQLLDDVGTVAQEAVILIEQGSPADVILRTIETKGCDLVITGVARDELLGRFSLGKTVDQLLRRSRAPLLVVKERARKPYQRIVVATDFSTGSRYAFEAAAHFFPEHRLTLFHAYDAPMSGLMTDPARYRRHYGGIVAQDCEVFLKGLSGPPGTLQQPHVVIEHGAPDQLLRQYVREHDVDLVVLGTQGRSALVEAFIGSVAKQIMSSLPCDALVIREPAVSVKR